MVNQEISSPDIDVLNLDARSFNALKRAGVNTLADVEAQSEQLENTISPQQWKKITNALSAYNGVPMPGSLVEENILGDELTFDEIAEMVGEIIILDRSTESRNWYKAVKVEDVFVSNDDHRHLRYYDGAKQRGIIDEMYFSKSQRNPQRAWRVKPQDKPAELPTVKPEHSGFSIIPPEPADFDYSELDSDTAKALKGCEAIIKQETSGYFTMLGAKFKEAQELLANHGKGTFERWYSSIGFKRQTVYNLIQRYEFSSSPTIGGHEEIFEALPVTLSYEISKPTAPPELVDKVLSGDITSNSEYKKELEQIQEEARKAKERAEEAEKKAAFWSKTSAETSKENQQLRADRVSAMNRADNAERKNSELEQRIKELENRPVDVAVQTDDSLLKEKDQEISELKEQIERMSDKTVKSFVIRMSLDEFELLVKALEQADDRLKNIIKNARILKICMKE